MRKRQNIFMILGVAILATLPLVMVQKPEPGPDGKEVEIFKGADDQARDVINSIAPGYRPWFKPLMEPPSGEIATLLFALQAALGAGFIGYHLGASRARDKIRQENEKTKC